MAAYPVFNLTQVYSYSNSACRPGGSREPASFDSGCLLPLAMLKTLDPGFRRGDDVSWIN